MAKEKKVFIQDRTKDSKWHKSSAKRLAHLIEQIATANRTVGEGVHQIGTYLMEIRDKKLFRVDNAASFKEWVEDHTDFSRVRAHNCIVVAEHLTKDEAGKYGPTLSYTIAKSTGTAAENEVRRLAQNGTSPTEVEYERLRMLKEQRQSELPPKKRARGKRTKKVVEGPTRIGRNGPEKMTLEVPEKCAGKMVKVVGTVKIKKIKASKKGAKVLKEGWDRCVPKVKIGDITVRLEINTKKGLVRYKVL